MIQSVPIEECFCLTKESLYQKAPYLLCASGLISGLLGYVADVCLHIDWLLWSVVAIILAFCGYIIGKKLKELHSLTHIEPRTNLFNRRYFHILVEREVARQKHTHAPLCLAMIDVDNFKKINDRNGHVFGDKVLRKISDIIKINTRSIDILTRWGGDEFALVLPYTEAEDALKVCERIRTSVEQAGEAICNTTLSIGLVCVFDTTNYDQLIVLADSAMYEAKKVKNATFLLAHNGASTFSV